VKKDYADGSDSLDLIPIGAWHGNGRKVAWWSPILLAVRDEDTGTLQAVCKCMSGFSDQFYKAMNERYSPQGENTTYDKPWEYDSPILPDSMSLSPSFLCCVGQADGSMVRCEGGLGGAVRGYHP
jgi:ATP-dependent DNA ligase